ncbi:hypothetical protein TWF281_004823 [Arthrobotrys megalospora]
MSRFEDIDIQMAVISAPNSPRNSMSSPPPAYLPGDPPNCRHLSSSPHPSPVSEDSPQLKNSEKTHIILSSADIRIFSALTGVHQLCKLWWIVCVLVGMFAPLPPPLPYPRDYPDDPPIRLLSHAPVIPGIRGRPNLNTPGSRRVFANHMAGVSEHSSAFKMAVAAIVITFCMSLIKIGILQRMKTKSKGKYKDGVDPLMDRNMKGLGKEKYKLGAWWERYVNLGHWIGVIDEVFALVVTVWLLSVRLEGRRSRRGLNGF